MTIPRSGSGRQYGYGYSGKKKELTDEERKLLKGTVVPIKTAGKKWKKDPNMKFFFFRSGGNYHCSRCPATYRGGNDGTTPQGNYINTY